MTPVEIAKLYFDLSNQSDFEGISLLFTDSTTYNSQNTGMYIGLKDIIAMQKSFHGKFTSLHCKINSLIEVKPGVILFDYDFEGILPEGESIKNSGKEYVTVQQGKIQHIEIKSNG